MSKPTRWLFGDQLGPHFTDDTDHERGGHERGGHERGGALLLVESRRVFARRRFHRAKAHLVLSAMRHRAAEMGESVRYLRTGTYGEALAEVDGPLQVIQPTSWAAVRFVREVGDRREVERLPARGFVSTREEFGAWAAGRDGKRLLMEDFYRDARRRHGVLLDPSDGRAESRPEGGTWNFDHENREPPPKGQATLGVDEPPWPEEDDIDEEVRADLDRWESEGDVSFVGRDGPRLFAATHAEAEAVLEHFLTHRLPTFGAHEDAILEGDPWMSHSLLSAPMNLGLLDPLDVVRRAEEVYRRGDAPLASVEGFVRQVMGWRDYIWHLYWHLGEDYRRSNRLRQRRQLPDWFADLDGDAVTARCLSQTLNGVAERGWVHHIPRLMVLGSYALQRGWSPDQLTDWFHRSFVDGYDWVMVPNVVGMSQHADGGVLATKPYTSGGAYLNTMSDHCTSCDYNPRVRVGEDACPFTAGYWWFLHRHREELAGNHRMAHAVNGLDRLKDLPALIEQEERRGSKLP